MPVVQASYCQRTDLPIYGTTAEALEDVDVTVQDRCIVGASARIAGALKSQVNLPLVEWGEDIVRAAAILAAYDAINSTGGNPEAGDAENDPLRIRYEDVVAWLKLVSGGMGTTAVGSPSPPAETASPGGAAVYSNEPRGWQNSSTRGAFTGRRR